jgi:transglutaminase-like putative cysteine protease
MTEKSPSPARRDFLRMSAATGFVSILGCGREAEPGSAPATGDATGTGSSASATPLPRAAVDPIEMTAAALGKNLERIFQFVQNEVHYEPYPGVLRAPVSALAGRAGNAADQAALLAALLAASGIPHRFAIGPLAASSVGALDAASAADLASVRDSSAKARQADAGFLRTYADATNAAQTKDPLADPERFAIAPSEIRETATRQFKSAIDSIQSALSKSKIAVSTKWSGIPKMERERHVWVQAQSGSEWIDLDPSFPGTPIGTVHAASQSTAEALPDDMRHRVEFIVSVETWSGGKLVIAPVLEFSAFADALASVPVSFTNVKADDLQALNVGGLTGGRGQMKYNAVLEVGTRLHIGQTAISFGGAPGGGGGDGGTLVDALGAGVESVGLPEGEAIAEWLEIRLTRPDGESHSAVRTIFDRISMPADGDAAQHVGNVPPVEIIELPEGSREYLPCRAMHSFSIAGGASSMLSLAVPPAKSAIGPLSWLAQAYHFARDAITAEIAPQQGTRVFLDSPCVASFTIELVAGATELQTIALFDLWHRGFGVLPLAGQEAAYPPQMVAGVLSHVAERCVSRDGYGPPAASAQLPASVGAVFEKAVAQGLGVRALRGDAPDSLPFAQEAQAHFLPYLRAGAVVVIPERYPDGQSRIGWWLVNPATGRTQDRMDDGRGATQVETVSITTKVISVASCITALVSLCAALYQAAAKHLGLLSEAEDEFLDRVGVVMEVLGFVTGAGCTLYKFVPRPRPPPRFRVPGPGQPGYDPAVWKLWVRSQ